MDEHTPLGMIGAALAELRVALGLDSALVVDSTDIGRTPQPLYVVGLNPSTLLVRVGEALRITPAATSRLDTDDGGRILVCPWVLPPNRAGGLVLLRGPAAPRWTAADLAQAAIAAPLLRVMLEFGPDEMGIDRLTGLPNRMYFLDEADRHIERLAQDRLSGTLMTIELDGLDQFTLTHGQPARDWTLARIGTLVRAMVRPADLVGRVGGAAFAVWLNGADHMTAAERAEVLCGRRLTLPEAPGRGVILLPSLSVGIASRMPDSEEDARGLLLRARDAAALARRGGGGWHVARGRG
jgi:diguanylate cyclase (GGDEF)-like protein